MTFSFDSRETYNIYICCLGFRCYQSFVMSSSHNDWNDHIPFNQNKLHQFALLSSVLSNQAYVSKHMFDQTTCRRIIFVYTFDFPWHLSLVLHLHSLILKGLPMWDFGRETWFCGVWHLQTADRRLQTACRRTQRRCSAKYLFRIGNSAGWQDIYFHRLRLGITNISSSAGWNRRKYRETGQETGT